MFICGRDFFCFKANYKYNKSMRQTELFTKTLRTPPKDEESKNAKFLAQGGFVQKLMAGVYTFLPLGLRVLNKIENIVREEMNKTGGIEILMPALHPKENWEATGRWEHFDALFRLKSRSGSDYALGPTHEEILYPLLTHHIASYKDLPKYIYQIQTKFRDEPRAKSGLLRGREFRMKDFYSFHANQKDRDAYYEVIKKTYLKIFERLGLDVVPTHAFGGTFSERSTEFQLISDAGEDTIFFCPECKTATNKELSEEHGKCPNCGGKTSEERAIEVGNIFPLKDKYAQDFNLTFKDENGYQKLVSVGCYGLGTSRVMGAIAEVLSDEKGLIWPKNTAPFAAHLLAISGNDSIIKKEADAVYQNLLEKGVEVLYDDREDNSAGEKFADADLIGIPFRIVVSAKTIASGSVEVKKRDSSEAALINKNKILDYVQ